MKISGKTVFSFYLLFLLIGRESLFAEDNIGLYGYNAIINAPTAYILDDGHVAFGFGSIPKPYGVLVRPTLSNYTYYAAIGFLPFLEISMGFVRPENFKSRWGIGDRTASFKFRILKDRGAYPAISFGLRDPFGPVAQDWAQHFTSSYIVCSKKKQYQNITLRLHCGYGTDWIKAAHHQLVGAFGGVDISINNHTTFLFEYDTDTYNIGMRILLMKRLSIMCSYINIDAFSTGISLYFDLL